MDWQFAACANPLLDYGTLAYLSMEPETTEEKIDELPTIYHNTFTTVCAQLGIDAPWSREEFKRLTYTEGYLLCFLWSLTAYEVAEKFPAVKRRMIWAAAQCFEHYPGIFKRP